LVLKEETDVFRLPPRLKAPTLGRKRGIEGDFISLLNA